MTTSTAVKRPRTKYAVDYMSEGDWLVRGTLDPMEALRLVVDELGDGWATDRLLWGVSRETWPDDIDFVLPDRAGKPRYGDVDQTAVGLMAGYLYELLEKARPGLYRKVHCLPSSEGYQEGCSWELGYAKTKGPGVFEGVFFRS